MKVIQIKTCENITVIFIVISTYDINFLLNYFVVYFIEGEMWYSRTLCKKGLLILIYQTYLI